MDTDPLQTPTSPLIRETDSESKTAERKEEDAQPSLKVVLRIRPPHNPRDSDTIQILDETTVRTNPPTSTSLKSKSKFNVKQLKEFTFTRVHGPQSTQQEVYASTAASLVDGLCQGTQNGLLFSYGITNAGKTHTIVGNHNQPGLLPQALESIFSHLAGRTDGSAVSKVVISYLEIYNENIYDLLQEGGIMKSKQGLKLVDRKGNIEVKDLSKHPIQSVAEGLELIERGSRQRAVAQTQLNLDSSRSHSVCTIELQGAGDGGGKVLWVVDLAGSERGSRTKVEATGKRQNEANKINASLMTLWRCLDAMRHNQACRSSSDRQVVPFRESKLTHLFMNHLAGNQAGATVMVVNANPCPQDFDETQHVLVNGAVAQQVKTIRDENREARANALLAGRYGMDGRRLKQERRRRSRKSIMQAGRPSKATKPRPRTIREDSVQDDDSSYSDGADSDTCLVDTRQSMFRSNEMLGAENRMLRKAVQLLRAQIVTMETEYRQEMANELQSQIKQPHTFSTSDLEAQDEESARNIIQKAQQRYHIQKMQRYIEELEEQLEECEEEIEQMQAELEKRDGLLDDVPQTDQAVVEQADAACQTLNSGDSSIQVPNGVCNGLDARSLDLEEKTGRLQNALTEKSREVESMQLHTAELQTKLTVALSQLKTSNQSRRTSAEKAIKEEVSPLKHALEEAKLEISDSNQEVEKWKQAATKAQNELKALQKQYTTSSLHKGANKANAEEEFKKRIMRDGRFKGKGCLDDHAPSGNVKTKQESMRPTVASPVTSPRVAVTSPRISHDKEESSSRKISLYPLSAAETAGCKGKDRGPVNSMPKRVLEKDAGPDRGVIRALPDRKQALTSQAPAAAERLNPFEGFGFFSKLFKSGTSKDEQPVPTQISIPRYSISADDCAPSVNPMSPTGLSRYYGSLLQDTGSKNNPQDSQRVPLAAYDSNSPRTSIAGSHLLLNKLKSPRPVFLDGPLSPNEKSEEVRSRISMVPMSATTLSDQENNIFKDLL